MAVHFADLQLRPISPGEFRHFRSRWPLAELTDMASKEYRALGLEYLRLSEERLTELLLAHPAALRLPLIRFGKRCAVGQDLAAWESWLTGG